MLTNKPINLFLMRLEKIYKQNPKMTNNEFYSLLVHENTCSFKIDHNFEKWIERFEKKENIKVFNSDDWKYFCQFVNKAAFLKRQKIKLYIPLAAEFIYEGANMIFDFLSENDIKHLSKIGSHERNDNIVIRVDNIKDVKMILDFVKNNEQIQEYLLTTNPFIFNQDGVGMAIDGSLSFNQELANLIKKYFDERIRLNIDAKPSIDELKEFMFDEAQNIVDNDDLRLIYQQIYMRIVKPDYSFDDFRELVNTYQKNDEILMDALVVTKNVYGLETMKFVISELLNGNFDYIAKEQRMRLKVKKNLDKEQVRFIILRKCGLGSNEEINDEVIGNFLLILEQYEDYCRNKYSDALIFAVTETATKYGFIDDINKISEIILDFLLNGDFFRFTASNGARERLKDVFEEKWCIMEKIRNDADIGKHASIDDIVKTISEKVICVNKKNNK